MNMTGGVNCEGARHTRLTIVGVCSSGALPLIYIGEREREQPRGCPSRRNPTWGPNPIRPYPPTIISEGRRKKEEGEKEGGG